MLGKVGRFATVMILFAQLSSYSWAIDTNCSVCGMTISEDSRNHILLKKEASEPTPLHICSASCAHKAKKHDPKLTQSQVSDFNHPDRFIPGDQAFFLIKSDKIKADLGPRAMPPYFGAFATKAEADVAQKKYGDGEIVQGFDNVVK